MSLFDSGHDGEGSGVGFVEICIMFVMQCCFSFGSVPFDSQHTVCILCCTFMQFSVFISSYARIVEFGMNTETIWGLCKK